MRFICILRVHSRQLCRYSATNPPARPAGIATSGVPESLFTRTRQSTRYDKNHRIIVASAGLPHSAPTRR